MNTVKIADLTPNQLTYAVGLAEVKKGLYTMDPLRAGLPRGCSNLAIEKFKEQYAGLNIYPVQPFMQDVDGVLYLWGQGEWMVGTFNTATGLPHISHGPGGEFSPLQIRMCGVYILDREKISVNANTDGESWTASQFWACADMPVIQIGKTLLDAGLRCYVGSVYGESVDLPSHVK